MVYNPDILRSIIINWSYSPGRAERLAAVILIKQGYDVDPSCPAGGPDGGKDGVYYQDGQSITKGKEKWIMAVNFRDGQVTKSKTKKKFEQDLQKAKSNNASGMAFVTNQKITPKFREELEKISKDSVMSLDLYHLERVTNIMCLGEMRHEAEILITGANSGAITPFVSGGFVSKMSSALHRMETQMKYSSDRHLTNDQRNIQLQHHFVNLEYQVKELNFQKCLELIIGIEKAFNGAFEAIIANQLRSNNNLSDFESSTVAKIKSELSKLFSQTQELKNLCEKRNLDASHINILENDYASFIEKTTQIFSEHNVFSEHRILLN